MFDYKRAFIEYGVGYFPSDHNIKLAHFEKLDDTDFITLIHIYGYSGPSAFDEIKAFQMHFSTSDISGTLTDITKKNILNLCVDYFNYNDKYHGLDNEFRNQLRDFIENNYDRANGFLEYISIN